MTKSNFETAELLIDAFTSVFVKEPDGPLNRECYVISDELHIGNIVITIDDVSRELKIINVSKSKGPDGIHPKSLKELVCNCHENVTKCDRVNSRFQCTTWRVYLPVDYK